MSFNIFYKTVLSTARESTENADWNRVRKTICQLTYMDKRVVKWSGRNWCLMRKGELDRLHEEITPYRYDGLHLVLNELIHKFESNMCDDLNCIADVFLNWHFLYHVHSISERSKLQHHVSQEMCRRYESNLTSLILDNFLLPYGSKYIDMESSIHIVQLAVMFGDFDFLKKIVLFGGLMIKPANTYCEWMNTRRVLQMLL